MSTVRLHCEVRIEGRTVPRFPLERLFSFVNVLTPDAELDTVDDTTTLTFEGIDTTAWNITCIVVDNRCAVALIDDSVTAAGRTILRPGGLLFYGSTSATTGVPVVRPLAVPCNVDAILATDSFDLAPE